MNRLRPGGETVSSTAPAARSGSRVCRCIALLALLFLAASSRAAESSAGTPPAWPRYELEIEAAWQLNQPDRRPFDASGLLLRPDGAIFTVSNLATELYRIEFLKGTNAANLTVVPGIFTPEQLRLLRSEQRGGWDCEGLAQDEQGRIYACEESNRWIVRCDPRTGSFERLKIDWSPVRKYFSPLDANASFEGVAVGGGKLYVANERMLGRIIVVDLETLRVESDFLVSPAGVSGKDVHYSDLCWSDGSLFALLRDSRCVLQIEPESRRVLAEYGFRKIEQDPEYAYQLRFGTGNMEGLAVDRDHFYLVTDNNGLGRLKYPRDTRPTLFRCARPRTTDKQTD